MHAHTLGLPGSEEEEGAARGDRDDGDGDGHHGLGALPLQEVHGCARPRPSLPRLANQWAGLVGPRGVGGGILEVGEAEVGGSVCAGSRGGRKTGGRADGLPACLEAEIARFSSCPFCPRHKQGRLN
jgi:hypothetical protein